MTTATPDLSKTKGRGFKPYLGRYHGERSPRGRRAFVMGDAVGPWRVPRLLTVGAAEGEVFDEFDERHGRRVGTWEEERDLHDYGPDAATALDKAMNDGDVRINDGGTCVWVNHDEWLEEFPSATAALAWLRATFGPL